MKKMTIRRDLMSKMNYSKSYGISRPTLDKKINDGELAVEHIDGVDYIKLF